MSSSSLPPGVAAHQRQLAEQRNPPPAPPRQPSDRERRRAEKAHGQHMQAAFNQLGARFARWARSRGDGYQPIDTPQGLGWKIGDMGRMPYPDTDSPSGDFHAYRANHTPWYVLANGEVVIGNWADPKRRMAQEPDTRHFIQVVRTNWGIDLSQ